MTGVKSLTLLVATSSTDIQVLKFMPKPPHIMATKPNASMMELTTSVSLWPE